MSTETPEPTAGQAATDEPRATTVASRDRWRTFGAPALAAVTVAALCLGVLLGWLSFGQRTPGDDSVDAGFARDMGEHHAQALEMSFLVLERTEDPDVRQLAMDITNNQATERGMMTTWLRMWDLPFARPDGARMTWMEHDHAEMEALPPGVPMFGMASPEEIQELTDASGQEAEVLFLQLMTTHHISGVEMAEAALADASTEEVRAAAQRMVSAQFGEIYLMEDLLQQRDAEPREDIDAWAARQGGHGSHGGQGDGEDDEGGSDDGAHDH